MELEEETRLIEDWLAQKILSEMDRDGFLSIFTELCTRIDRSLFPIFRCHITMNTLHTFFAHNDFTWYRSGLLNANALPRSTEARNSWSSSPFYPMLEKLLPELRLNMKDPANIANYPIFQELLKYNVTDYFALLIPFGALDKVAEKKDGLMVSWVTDNPAGFEENQIAIIRRLTIQFAAAARIFKREQTLDNILKAYLGDTPSKEILNGATQRGDGSSTRAVIWICDLRKSTELAFKLEKKEYLTLLNKFFEHMAQAVHAHSGEILKFMGDGFLAIFPATNETEETLAAWNAINAALEAEIDFAKHFPRDELSGFGIGIHLGDVMFGNIGSPERLDFSVIGPAVNIASRLQELTKSCPSSILVSGDVAEKVDLPFVRHAAREIRGSNICMDVFSPVRD